MDVIKIPDIHIEKYNEAHHCSHNEHMLINM